MTQRLPALIAVAVLAGCAGAPPVAPDAPAGAADAAAVASAGGAPAAAVQATSTAAAETATTRFPGTRPRRLSNGQTVYCWTDKKLGTRLLKETCATAEVLEQQSSAARGAFEEMRATKSGVNPSQPSGP